MCRQTVRPSAMVLFAALVLGSVGCDSKSKLEGTWTARIPELGETHVLYLSAGTVRLHAATPDGPVALVGTYRVPTEGIIEMQLRDPATGLQITTADRYIAGDKGLTLTGVANGQTVYYVRVK